MPKIYDLTSDFGKTDPNGTLIASVSPSWLIGVVRYAHPITSNRSQIGNPNEYQIQNNDLTSKAREEREPLLIDSACVGMTINNQKDTHTTSMQATLMPNLDYLQEIRPGDWVLAWMCQNDQDIQQVRNALASNGTTNTANSFHSGLKFVGKVHGVVKLVAIQGIEKYESYTLSAYGFTEFDNPIVYFKQIGIEAKNFLLPWQDRLGMILDNVATDTEISCQKILPAFIDCVIGNGFQKPNANRIKELPATANTPYIVPSTVYSLLANTIQAKDVAASGGNNGTIGSASYAYTDILKGFIGIQTFAMNTQSGNNSYTGLIPNTKRYDDADKWQQGYYKGMESGDLIGFSPPFTPSLDYKPLWSLLQEFLNPGLNEMYTSLKVGDDSGNIYPCFVARQYPFGTEFLEKDIQDVYGAPKLQDKHHRNTKVLGGKELLFTKFLDLPRWKVDDGIINSYTVGTDQSRRSNLVQIIGVSPAFASVQNADYYVFLNSKPKYDEIDIARNGIKPYIRQVNSSLKYQGVFNPYWSLINADFLINQELTLSGGFSLQGIQSPICIGDNLQYKDVVYHIEGVAHSVGITRAGQKFFKTDITVTHGCNALQADTLARPGQPKETAIYPTLVDDLEIGDQPAINKTDETV